MPACKSRSAWRLTTWAAALVCGAGSPAYAVITTAGSVGWNPPASVVGPGDTHLPGSSVWVGSSGQGSLLVDSGSFLRLARLSFGLGGTGNGTGLVTGAGTLVELVGNGASGHQVQRLVVGEWGTAQLTVSAGAALDTRGNPAPCLLAFHYCDSFVGGAAGDNAVLNIDGAGTQVRLGQNLFVAAPGLAIQHLDGYTYGVPGGTTRGTVNISQGALLSTDRATIAPRHWSTHATRRERNFGEVNVTGAGSRWVVVGGSQVDHSNGQVLESGASILTANDPNAWATVNVTGGGVIDIQGQSGVYNYINLSNGGGRTDMLISGAGSAVRFSGDAGALSIGRRLGTASVAVLDGASVSGLFYLSAGRDGSMGDLLINGAGSTVRLNGTASAAANGNSGVGFIDIGRNGTGTVTVSGGGQLLVEATQATTNSPGAFLGRDAASSGTLNIAGAGSMVKFSAQSVLAGGGAGEAFNPVMRVGRDGSGFLNITAGGKLLIEGNAVSVVGNSRSTDLSIGGNSDTVNGGRGLALVSGAGSEISLTGHDTFIGVGYGPQSNGQLTVRDHASVSAIGMNVGRSGGIGVLRVDNATLAFSGQQTGNLLAGAFLSIGRSGGVGVAEISHGSTVTMTNFGSAGASLNLGGTAPGPLGDGSLTLSGASALRIVAAPGLATLSVARDGSGLMRIKGASTVDVGDGNTFVGRLKGSDGTLLITEASTLSTGWLGVGRDKTNAGDVDGGTGTLVLVNSSIQAQTIVIGSNGFLGGTGTINGTVVNHGIFAPGNSPGTLEITGGYTAAAGSRMILEVQADGSGGFATDQLIFGAGQALDLSHLSVEFRFLGSTSPTAFLASQRFGVDTFFQQRSAGGGMAGLAPAAFGQASFSASADAYRISGFSFSAAAGASFSAAPVPEPGQWAMVLAGLLWMGGLARRRARR